MLSIALYAMLCYTAPFYIAGWHPFDVSFLWFFRWVTRTFASTQTQQGVLLVEYKHLISCQPKNGQYILDILRSWCFYNKQIVGADHLALIVPVIYGADFDLGLTFTECSIHFVLAGTYKTQELPCGIRVAGNP